MAVFNTTSFASTRLGFGKSSGSGSGSGKSMTKANNDERINMVEYDSNYVDSLGNPKNADYFLEKIKSIDIAISQARTPAEKNTYVKDRLETVRALNKWQLGQSSILKETKETFDAQNEAEWKTLWSNKTGLRGGQFLAMVEAESERMMEEAATLRTLKSQMEEITVDTETLENMDTIIERYDERESLFRRAANNPGEFALDIRTDKEGNIQDIQLKDINADGLNLSNEKQDGFALSFVPHAALFDDVTGENVAKVPGATFLKGTSDKRWIMSPESTGIKWENAKVADPLGMSKGELWVNKEDGKGYTIGNDGKIVSTNYSPADMGITRSIPMTSKEARQLENSTDVIDISKFEKANKEAEIKRRMDATIDELDPNIKRYLELDAMDVGKEFINKLKPSSALSGWENIGEVVAPKTTSKLKHLGSEVKEFGDEAKTAWSETAKDATNWVKDKGKQIFKGLFGEK